MNVKPLKSALLAALTLMSVLVTPVFADDTSKTATRRPLIGINTDLSGDKNKQVGVSVLYYQAIEKAGGIPVLLPPVPASDIPSVLSKLDGLVLTGGMDYPPASYGEKPESTTKVMAEDRSAFDLALAKAAMANPKLSILGICAGCQLLNINGGGTLTQDIPSHHPESKVAHASPEGWEKGFNHHEVTFTPGTRLGDLYKAPLSVPTSHHQCINKIGKGMKVVGKSNDGLPEAIELPGERFVVGVQFHPERDYESNKKLFAQFIEKASKH